MRLDHVSYVASHDQISDVVNRIGSQIGTAFIDGGIHPKFGTRNFTAPLLNGQYIEIVCPLDHPATDTTPFGIAVSKKSLSGGGWLAWVVATEVIGKLENHFGRNSINGLRKKPNGEILSWHQIGVSSVIDDPDLPFFIEWISGVHPSRDGNAFASIKKININTQKVIMDGFMNFITNDEIMKIKQQINLMTLASEEIGITSVEFNINNKIAEIS